jgi:hypothetical protein
MTISWVLPEGLPQGDVSFFGVDELKIERLIRTGWWPTYSAWQAAGSVIMVAVPREFLVEYLASFPNTATAASLSTDWKLP